MRGGVTSQEDVLIGFSALSRLHSVANNTVVHLIVLFYSTFFIYLNIICFDGFVKQILEKKNDAKVVGLPRERFQAALFNCICALVCQDTQESVAWGRVLNPQCTPTGPSRSLHARVVVGLFVCSHSIYTHTQTRTQKRGGGKSWQV